MIVNIYNKFYNIFLNKLLIASNFKTAVGLMTL